MNILKIAQYSHVNSDPVRFSAGMESHSRHHMWNEVLICTSRKSSSADHLEQVEQVVGNHVNDGFITQTGE